MARRVVSAPVLLEWSSNHDISCQQTATKTIILVKLLEIEKSYYNVLIINNYYVEALFMPTTVIADVSHDEFLIVLTILIN